MSLQLPFGVRVLNPLPVEDKYLNNGVPYTATTQVNTLVASGVRFVGLTVNINNVEYWYATGTSNGALVVKSPSVVSGGGVTGATNGLTKYSNGKVGLGGVLTGNTTISGSSHQLTITDFGKLNLTDSLGGGINIIDNGGGGITISSPGSGGIFIGDTNSDNGSVSMNDRNNVNMFYSKPNHNMQFTLSAAGAVFSDSRTGTTAHGIEYQGNYAANYTKRSLVDKAYVTGLTSTISVPVTGATNGLSLQGKNIVLGGILTGNTTISGSSYQLNLGGNAGLSQINLKSTLVGVTTTSGDVVVTSGHDINLFPANDLYAVATHNVDMYANNQVQFGASNHQITLSPSGFDLSQAAAATLTLGSNSGFAINNSTNNIIATLNGSGVFAYAADYSANYTSRSLVDKGYTDSIAAGLDPKQAVRVATTAALGGGATYHATGGTTPTGSFTSAPSVVDGITLANGNRILVKNQVDPKQNGIYTVITGGTWYRSSDLDGTPASEVAGGDFLFVQTGATQAATGWVLTGNGVLTINTDSLNFVQFSAANAYIAGSGISIIGNTISNTGVITANNGLTKSGTNVHLGGALTGDTLIDGASSGLNLGDSTHALTHFGVYATSDITLKTNFISNIVLDSSVGNILLRSSGHVKVTGNTISFHATSGATYDADYSANYQPRSLVDKGYVDSLVTGATASTNTTAGNGLTKVGNTIVLGGTLTGDTAIGFGGFGLTIHPDGNLNLQSTSGDTVLAAYDGGITIQANTRGLQIANYSPADPLTIQNNSSGGTSLFNYNGLLKINGYAPDVATNDSLQLNTYGGNFKVNSYAGDLELYSVGNAIKLTALNASGMTLTSNGKLIISGSSTGFTGAKYSSDYSANFTPRSLVDKGYVDGLFGTSGITTANNGLTKSGNNVHLGGTLTGNTTISGQSYTLNIGDQTNGINTVAINANNYIQLFAVPTGASIYLSKDGTAQINATNGDDKVGYLNLVTNSFEIDLSGYDSPHNNIIIDNRTGTNQSGIEYLNDYSANFSPRSLVDKGYVTGFTASLALTDGNGTTANGTAVDLGGTLNNDVNIDGEYNINIGQSTPITSLNVLSENIGGTGLSLRANSNFAGTHYVQIYTDNDSNLMYLSAVDSGGETTIRLGSSSNPTQIYSTYSGFQGLMYDQDYSSNFNARSLPDVAFVTGLTFSASTLQGAYVTDPSFTMSASTSFVGVSGSTTGITVYLPASPVIYKQYIVSDIAGNAFMDNIIVDGNGNLIQGSSTAVINTDYGSVTFVYNGFNWSVVAIV